MVRRRLPAAVYVIWNGGAPRKVMNGKIASALTRISARFAREQDTYQRWSKYPVA